MAAVPRLLAEWHTKNPPANQVARNSNTKYLWVCPQSGTTYEASCDNRNRNRGCPCCANPRGEKTIHPLLSIGRPDLAEEWFAERNEKSPNEVTLGSNIVAWWRCRNSSEHLWQTQVFNRALYDTGCPECGEVNRGKKHKFGPA